MFVMEFYLELLLMTSTMNDDNHLQDKDDTPICKDQESSVELADKDPTIANLLLQQWTAWIITCNTSNNTPVNTKPTNTTPTTEATSKADDNGDRLLHSQHISLAINSIPICNTAWDMFYHEHVIFIQTFHPELFPKIIPTNDDDCPSWQQWHIHWQGMIIHTIHTWQPIPWHCDS